MKIKQLIIIAFIFGTIGVQAQTSFTCYYREYCTWNETEETFDNCEGYDEASLFVVNADETMFTHTIESMKSTYYVGSKEYDEELEVWSYDVTSDAGNEYFYVFDPKNKEIRVLYIKDEQTMMIRFYVKAIF